MDAIKISVVIGEDRRLVVQLPDDTPVGPAEVVIKPSEVAPSEIVNPAREAARAKLLAAGALSTAHYAPEGFIPPSEEELERIGRLLGQGRSSLDLINEDRGEY